MLSAMMMMQHHKLSPVNYYSELKGERVEIPQKSDTHGNMHK